MSKKMVPFVFLFLVLIFMSPLVVAQLQALEATAEPAAKTSKPIENQNPVYTPPLGGTPAYAGASYPNRMPAQYWANQIYRPGINEKLAEVLIAATEQAGTFAKSLGQNISEYVKEKQLQKKQLELVENFYFALGQQLQKLDLSPSEYQLIVQQVEEIYIHDGQSQKPELDSLYFRELPHVVKKEYGDLVLNRTQDGPVMTYYLNGSMKTRWQLQKGEPHGKVVTYYENGEILYIDTYDEGVKLKRRKYDREGKLEFEQDYETNPSEVSLPAPELKSPSPAPQEGTVPTGDKL